MRFMLITGASALAAVLTLTACEKPGGAADQTDQAANLGQDAASAVTGAGTAAVGSVSSAALVDNLAIGDMYEIEAAKMALDRSNSAEVKRLAQMILTDHTASTEKLKMLVASGQVTETLPTMMDERRMGLLDNLRGAAGTDFDGRYIEQQVAAHQEAIAMLKGYEALGTNDALKAFSMELQPKIQMHLDMAQNLAGQAANHMGDATAPPAEPVR